MATLLLLSIYIVYIGLGVPDSSFGTALPAMWQELNLPISLASVVTILISFGTTVSSFFSARIINFLKPGLTVALSTLISAIALFCFSLSNDIFALLALSIPLGLSAGAIDASMNGFVATHYKPMHMNFLHCFYGVGVIIGPVIFSFTLLNDNDWRLGFKLLALVQLTLAGISMLSLPLWSKTYKAENLPEQKLVALKYRAMLKNPAVRAILIAFFATCALEFTCNTWGTSYLVSIGFSEAHSAKFLTFYYLGITLGRFLSGIMTSILPPKRIFPIGYTFILIAIILLFLPLPIIFKGVALFMIGFGNGPAFPNLTCVFPMHYRKEVSQSLVSAQMFVSNLGILIMPPLSGVIADVFSTKIFPIYLLIIFIVLVVSTIKYINSPKGEL